MVQPRQVLVVVAVVVELGTKVQSSTPGLAVRVVRMVVEAEVVVTHRLVILRVGVASAVVGL